VSTQHPLRILSIEDDPKDTELIQDLLETEGIVCEVTRVDTEASLRDLLKRGGIDLILADYSLPSFDGISALKLAAKACPDVPFIFVSGTLGEEVAIEALKIGATDYVLKTRLSRLVPSVLRALREATQRAERKRAEASLRQSETYLAGAQRLSKTGSFGWRPSTGEILWSEETFRVFQYDRTTTPTVKLVLQRVHPEDAPLVKQTIEHASQAGKNFEHKYRLLMPDGSVKHVHIVARALRDESGSVEFVGAVMDVTVAKQAEETLRESEAYLAEAQRLSHTGSWASTPATGDIRYWSEECYRVLGFDPHGGQPRFETFFQRIHPDDQRRLEQVKRASRDKTGFEFDYRIVHPGGEIREIHTVGHPVFSPSGDLVEYVGTVMDVTERKRGEQATRLLAAVVESSHDAIVSKNLDGTITSWNTGAERLFGYAPEEAVGQNITLIIPPDRRDEERAIVEQLTRGERVDHFETVRMHKDGSLLDVALTISPMKDAAGRIVGASKLARDITERKRAEEALRPGAGRSRVHEPGNYHGRVDRFFGARDQTADFRSSNKR
jgi:PAS domain S-box-containing protein